MSSALICDACDQRIPPGLDADECLELATGLAGLLVRHDRSSLDLCGACHDEIQTTLTRIRTRANQEQAA